MQNTDLSGDIRNLTEGHRLLSEQVYRLSNTQYKLANYIIELKYGGKKELYSLQAGLAACIDYPEEITDEDLMTIVAEDVWSISFAQDT